LPETPERIEGTPAVLRAAYADAFRSMDPWVRSTGLRLHDLRHRSLSHSNDPRVAEDFLVNTRLRRGDRETELTIASYMSDAGGALLSLVDSEPETARGLPLPPSVPLQISLDGAIGRRASVRSFTGDAIDLPYLATIVRAAAGVTRVFEIELADGEPRQLHLRATASAGGLYPIELYVAAMAVERLPRRVYRYDAKRDALVEAGREDAVDRLPDSFALSEDVVALSRAAVVFLLVGRPWRTMRKYGDRGMRFVFIEAGAMAENVDLASAALGFGAVDCASLYDDEIHELLEIDGVYRALVHAIVVGAPG
jgi:SagB-type dehydrogenase family enzyme